MKKLLHSSPFLAFFVLMFSSLLGCLDNTQRPSYDIRNTQWKTQGAELEISLFLRFGPENVIMSYEDLGTYEREDATFDYSSQNYQGSILIKDFAYDTGNILDATWLFTVADDTQNMQVVFFKKSDETRAILTLTRETITDSEEPEDPPLDG